MSQAGAERRRRSRVEVEELVAEYQASGLTRDAFCQQRDLSVAALDKYRRRVQKWSRSCAGSMLPVEVVSSTVRDSHRDAGGDGVLVVALRGGCRIEVRPGFDAGTLERLLTVLDRA
jgi:hypothetical protein